MRVAAGARHFRVKPRSETAGNGGDFDHAFFAARIFAHLARCAAAILFLPAAEIVRLARFDAIGMTLCAFILAHRARCARAILRREAADTMWVARVDLRDTPEPFKDSITEIAWYNFSARNCACLCSSRSCWSAFPRLGIVTPSGILIAA
jgi:hypothetical protein